MTISNELARRLLGMEFLPAERTIRDTARRLTGLFPTPAGD